MGAPVKRKVTRGQVRRWKGGSKWEPPLYKLSENDEWCNATRERCIDAMGKWLEESVKLNRPIASLTRIEMGAMVQAVTDEFTQCRSERYTKEQEAIEEVSQSDLLFGI